MDSIFLTTGRLVRRRFSMPINKKENGRQNGRATVAYTTLFDSQRQ